MNERLAQLQYAAAWRLVRLLPQWAAQGLFRTGALLALRRGGPGVTQLRANLARVAPVAGPGELDALVRAGMISYARYWCETFRLSATDAAAIVAATAVTNPGPFDAAVDDVAIDGTGAGRGLIVALSHSGNWDAAGIWLIETLRARGRDAGFTTVAQRLRPDAVYRRFIAHREALGFELVAAEDGAYRALLRRLRRGGVVCVLADRDVLGTGLPVSLFGEPVPVPGPADVEKATQALADALGTLVAGDPSGWHVLQPLWVADRP